MSEPNHTDLATQLIELQVAGWVPSKKNLLKLTKTGRAYYDPEVKSRLVEIEDELRVQWAGRPPSRHPAIAMHFALSSARSDRDNKLTTILDCLVKAGVLEDDCIAKCNGPYLVLSAMVLPVPFTTVWVQPQGDIGPLLAKMDEVKFLTQLPASPVVKKKSRWKA